MRLGSTTEVVGSVVHDEQVRELLASSALRDVVAVLQPEPFNHADSHAVAVYVEGQLVGHLPRATAHAQFDFIADTMGRSGLATVRASLRAGVRPSVVIEPEGSEAR